MTFVKNKQQAPQVVQRPVVFIRNPTYMWSNLLDDHKLPYTQEQRRNISLICSAATRPDEIPQLRIEFNNRQEFEIWRQIVSDFTKVILTGAYRSHKPPLYDQERYSQKNLPYYTTNMTHENYNVFNAILRSLNKPVLQRK